MEMCQGPLFDKLPNREEEYLMLKALRDASLGKMFLEREYANSTTKLCEYLEKDNKAEEATDIIQEIQIETYGSLEVREKLTFILY
jgi:26S proteasome regulatory subunit N5